jgi:hypothetical protein
VPTELLPKTEPSPLSDRELRALTQAAAWYMNYHGRMIAEQADDPSAAALARREWFLDLHAALGKLGLRLRLPDGLAVRS